MPPFGPFFGAQSVRPDGIWLDCLELAERTAILVVRLEKPAVPRFYLIVATLLLALLGLLQFATFPHSPVVAPPMSKLFGSSDIDRSTRVGGSTD